MGNLGSRPGGISGGVSNESAILARAVAVIESSTYKGLCHSLKVQGPKHSDSGKTS